ncbi:kelch repeat-containing protein [Brevibacillus sp. FSL K6-0770]|uniref:kelch repeat-containing protein n=1 Tax=Brevibacillus sp. FSL K6-0770 TaxID=2954673 RepID=UPI0030F93F15
MNDDRFGGASAVLADGDVVVIGGGMVATGERYDVKNDEWSSLAQMDEVRYGSGRSDFARRQSPCGWRRSCRQSG